MLYIVCMYVCIYVCMPPQSEIAVLHQEDKRKNFPSTHAGEECLERFCQICLNAAQESCNVCMCSCVCMILICKIVTSTTSLIF